MMTRKTKLHLLEFLPNKILTCDVYLDKGNVAKQEVKDLPNFQTVSFSFSFFFLSFFLQPL